DGGGGAANTGTTSAASAQPADTGRTNDTRQDQGKSKKSCDLTDVQCQLHQHANDLKNFAHGAEAVAGVASAIGTGCAIVGVVASETVVGGIAGGACAGIAVGVAAGASGAAALANLGAKAGGANVSNTDLALDVVGAIPGAGVVSRGARGVEGAEAAARG